MEQESFIEKLFDFQWVSDNMAIISPNLSSLKNFDGIQENNKKN